MNVSNTRKRSAYKKYQNMSLEQFNLNWHTYSDHLKEMMGNIMNSHKSADVTLVCDDKTKFKAHKFVISACSPLFQSIIDELPQKEDSLIYLRGVQPQEMKSILRHHSTTHIYGYGLSAATPVPSIISLRFVLTSVNKSVKICTLFS